MKGWGAALVFAAVLVLAVALFSGASMSGPPTVPWPEHPSLIEPGSARD